MSPFNAEPGALKKVVPGLGDVAVSGINDAVPVFTKVQHHHFDAEYAWIAGDLVLHFFLTRQLQAMAHERHAEQVNTYWLGTFPTVLDQQAREYFDSDRSRLVAKYTQELASWYFRAKGYDAVIDRDAYVKAFLERMEQRLSAG